MSDIKIVPFCFGRWGEKEEKLCKGDCNNCLELNDKEVIFCKKKKTYLCNMFCRCTKECQECYWEYFLQWKEGKYIDLREVIDKYIKKYNLKIKEFIRK